MTDQDRCNLCAEVITDDIGHQCPPKRSPSRFALERAWRLGLLRGMKAMDMAFNDAMKFRQADLDELEKDLK